jgi:NitT/TauT family transport system ATP-binding protein
LSGLAKPSSGALFWHGKPLADQEPNVAIVFQSFALFPWLTVLENVEAPLQARGVAAVERRKRALRMLDTVGLDGFETAYPKELSGGMKQRVGFARALVVEPEVLFMDEPFSALDVLTAENLRGELLELWLNKKMPTSAIFIVTHNIEEAVMMADRIVVLGRNPARIRSDFGVRLAQPRDRKSARFVELVDYIYKIMTEPDVEHALPDPESTGEITLPPGGLKKGQAPVRAAKYQMLPHARVGGIAGLVELLHDRGGREDLFRLSEDLVMDVEDLLPLLEACVLLGFALLKEGDVQLTSQGVRFADADIQRRKILFREAALDHVMILKQIDSILKKKSDHSIADEFFHDILDEHFSEDEVQRQFDTAMNWGRYAEIFDYDRDSGRLVQTEPSPLTVVEHVPDSHDAATTPKA